MISENHFHRWYLLNSFYQPHLPATLNSYYIQLCFRVFMAPLTLFLFEEMKSLNFRLESRTYDEMQEAGFTIQTIIRTLGLTEEANNYSFFLFGGFSRKAMKVVDDPTMVSCYEYHYNRPVITIIARYKSDPSPYYAQAPSAMESLHERRAISGIDDLENPALNPGAEDSEPSIRELLEPLDGFLDVWNLQSDITTDREVYLKKIRDKHPFLENNAKVFIRHLRRSYQGSRSYVKSTDCLYFLGEPYFSDQAVADILAIPLFPKTLKARLEMHSEERFIPCPCLVSIFLRAFNWNSNFLNGEEPALQSLNTEMGRNSSKGLTTLQGRLSKLSFKTK